MRSFSFTRRSAGFTLIELLVVIAILGLLSIITIPNLSRNTGSRRYREAARSVSSFIARAQSRAIGAALPRGLMCSPLASDSQTCLDLFLADAPPVYSGESLTSVATVHSGATYTLSFLDAATQSSDFATQARLQPPFVTAGDAIQFGGAGPKYKFVPPATVAMWFEDNQNIRNSSWPRAQSLPFKIWRQPTQGPGGGLQLIAGASIDLPWCCLGTRKFRDFMNPGGPFPSSPISIMFDATGKPSEIVHSGGARTSVGSPIFILIGQSELSGNDYDAGVAQAKSLPEPEDRVGANWQYSDCIWLCIDNNSGVVKSAHVAGGATNVLDSQRFARMGVSYAGGEK